MQTPGLYLALGVHNLGKDLEIIFAGLFSAERLLNAVVVIGTQREYIVGLGQALRLSHCLDVILSPADQKYAAA